MSKVFVTLAVLFLSVSAVFSQEAANEELQASKSRNEKLLKLNTNDKLSGFGAVDALKTACAMVSSESLSITPILENLYYRSVGESNDGVIDVEVKKPTVEECLELSARIAKQALAVKAAAALLDPATKEVKDIKNPMKAKGALNAMNYSREVLTITGEESVYQVKAIAAIIETVKSGDNL